MSDKLTFADIKEAVARLTEEERTELYWRFLYLLNPHLGSDQDLAIERLQQWAGFPEIEEAMAKLSEEQLNAIKDFIEVFSRQRNGETRRVWDLQLKSRSAADRSREEAIERLRRRARPLPAGFKFDRLEAHER